MTENQGLIIREGRTYLDAQSREGTISFVSPAFGPDNYVNVGNQIIEAGLESPTMAQTANLVYGAWENPKEKYSSDIISKLRNNWLWGFNGLLYVPNEGIYIQDRPEIKNGRVFMDKNDLVDKLASKDPSVRFVPFGTFKRESQSSLELAKNPFVQALAGEEGADKLARVADNYKVEPFVGVLDNVNHLTTRVASLDSSWGIDDYRLHVDGDDWNDSNIGFAFGVSDKLRSDAPKN